MEEREAVAVHAAEVERALAQALLAEAEAEGDVGAALPSAEAGPALLAAPPMVAPSLKRKRDAAAEPEEGAARKGQRVGGRGGVAGTPPRRRRLWQGLAAAGAAALGLGALVAGAALGQPRVVVVPLLLGPGAQL